MAIRRARGGYQFLFGGIQPPIQNVLPDCAVEKKSLLADDADLLSQGIQRGLANVVAINRNTSTGEFVEGWQQIHERRFSRAGRTNQGNHLAWPRMKRDIPQHGLV